MKIVIRRKIATQLLQQTRALEKKRLLKHYIYTSLAFTPRYSPRACGRETEQHNNICCVCIDDRLLCPGQSLYGRIQYRDDSMLAPNQWETSLQSNTISHWLGSNLESTLQYRQRNWGNGEHLRSSEIQNFLLLYGSLGTTDHDLYGSQSTGMWVVSVADESLLSFNRYLMQCTVILESLGYKKW